MQHLLALEQSFPPLRFAHLCLIFSWPSLFWAKKCWSIYSFFTQEATWCLVGFLSTFSSSEIELVPPSWPINMEILRMSPKTPQNHKLFLCSWHGDQAPPRTVPQNTLNSWLGWVLMPECLTVSICLNILTPDRFDKWADRRLLL